MAAIRSMRPDAKQKLLSTICILVQEVLEDNGLCERFKNWARRWGEDEPDACQFHRTTYSLLERHMMGITAAQFVWEPEEDTEEGAPDPATHEKATSSGAPPREWRGRSAAMTNTKNRQQRKNQGDGHYNHKGDMKEDSTQDDTVRAKLKMN